MRESIGQVQLYNIIILFIFLVMAIMVGTLAYNRTFKVNTVITTLIEKYEGFNVASRGEITDALITMGYERLDGRQPRCQATWDGQARVTPATEESGYEHNYCIYRSEVERVGDLGYIQYTIVTFSAVDLLPYLDLGGIPTVSRTNKIWCTGGNCSL